MAESAVIQGVVGKLVEYLADAIIKQVRYLCCYSCNVQTLDAEVGELNTKHDSLQQRLVPDRANSRVILQDVEAWLGKVEDLNTRWGEIRGDAEKVKGSCLCKRFPVLHYSLSRKALKTTNESVELRKFEFPIISTSRIPADIPPAPTSIFEFESRASIEEKIVDALKDQSVYSIGIWGIGGVGKSVMVRKIEERVLHEKLFKHVVLKVVSQQLDIPEIQSQIARELGLNISEDTPVSRQKKLHERLMDEKDILIILDDLWEGLDVEEIGIPLQSTRCKLILTSRNRDALTSTGISVQNIFQLEILTEEESWKFFTNNAGINVDDDSHEQVQIAKKVEGECMKLPLALKVVARALVGKDISAWNNAVRDLKKQVPDNISGVAKEVYGSLSFSINALGKEQKNLFLLCCLFPEDYFISLEELLRCVMGLRIFKELENLTEAGDKVKTVLDILLSRSLLMEGDEERDDFNVRMHDVIRDVGIWIATEEIEEHVYLIKYGENEWPTMEDDSFNNYTHISLQFSCSRIIFPESIAFPKLKFLRLDFSNSFENYCVELPENFFKGMSGLRVLEALFIELLPPLTDQLNNLRTLSLEQCKNFETISVLGKLTNLEMLSLRNCEFEVLPTEIGNLRKLKQMDIFGCRSLKRIAFGVVSGLVRLEELVILNSFDKWVADAGGEDDVACLSELNDLKYLTTLRIEIGNPSVVPGQEPLWVEQVKKYHIAVSNCSFDFWKGRFQKAILLGKEVENPLKDWIYKMAASDAEYVYLEGCNCIKFVKRLSKNYGNLSCLKLLRLSSFISIRYLVEGLHNSAIFPVLKFLYIEDSISLQQIFQVSPPTGSFKALESIYLFNLPWFVCLWKFSVKEQLYLPNLREINIGKCFWLSHLFSLSIAQSLVQLSELSVSDCQTIEAIFKREDGELVEIKEIKLPKLQKMNFCNLESFSRICSEIDRIELPELSELAIYNLSRRKMAEGDNNEIRQNSKVDIIQVTGIGFNFCVLRQLSVNGIKNLKCIFPPSVINSGLPNLSVLLVSECPMLEQIIGMDEENIGKAIIFPSLKLLNLQFLPNIRTFSFNAVQFPLLRDLMIFECPLMLKFVGLMDQISSSRPFLDKQVQCPKLENLRLDRLNISGVFSPLFFKSLTVEELNLTNCEWLEHMITKGEGQTVTDTEEEFIQMVPLNKLVLKKMPNLYGSVFEIKHSLEFPLLETIEIEDCPMLEKFSLGSLRMPKLKSVSGLLSIEFAGKFFSNEEIFSREIHSENNCFMISPKDIFFNDGMKRVLIRSDSSESFVDAVSNAWKDEIVGKFEVEKIRIGIEYEVMLIIMILYEYEWEDPFKTELKLSEGSKLQHTLILDNHPKDTWIEISIGKFVEESQQSKKLEFSMHLEGNLRRNLCIKGVKIVEV